MAKTTKNNAPTNGATEGSNNNAPTGKRRTKRTQSSFDVYIYRVLKQVHPNHTVSRKAMVAMDALCHDLFERICQEAGRVARYSKHQTLSSKDIQVATKLILRGELANHAVSAGIQSIVRYNGSESSN